MGEDRVPNTHIAIAYKKVSELRPYERNVRRGDPGYGAHLDRDNDGVGCERGF